MKRKIYISLLILCLSLFSSAQNAEFVNPFIGTGGHGHTFPGAVLPFGMVQLSPDTRVDNSWDACSGYHHNDSLIYGFSHTHLSGTGCSDYGDIMLMPSAIPTSNPQLYRSAFSHSNEKAEAGYYSVLLKNGNIKAELTSSLRTGFHRYTGEKPFYLILDLKHRDKLLSGKIEKLNDSTFQGFRISKAWAQNQKLYFYMQLSAKVLMAISTPEKIGLKFRPKNGQSLLVKVGISAVSMENAKLNADTEIPDWDFDMVRSKARQAWNKELSKIEITEKDKNQRTIFYTALYHSMIHPSLYSDVNGEYLGRDLKVHKSAGDYYTVFSLWDTFRALHPLLSIIDQKRTADFINTFILQYEQGGRLPVWELSSNETECMIGYHSVSVMADAMLKGIKGFDYEKAYQAAKHSAMLDHFGLKAYKEKGFIEREDENESVSRTLEYAYDDWCIAQMAQVLNKTEDYQYFLNRSMSYRNMFDKTTGHMRTRSNGGWLAPFDAREVNNNYTEGNSWQYTFFVPHDLAGLKQMYGGAAAMEKKLDALFSASSQTTGREQADISGLIGQYAHGNEPSHHMAYIYSYLGNGQKTQQKLDFILNNFYKNNADGLIGNEDCGQMSAWYVLSALGIYQICPARPEFEMVKPKYSKAVVKLENGKDFILECTAVGNLNKDKEKAVDKFSYVKLNFKQILNGEKIINGKISGLTEIKGKERDNQFLSAPTIHGLAVFDNSQMVSIEGEKNAKLYYSLVYNNDTIVKNQPYSKAFEISKSAVVIAHAEKSTIYKSKITKAHFHKRPNNWKISIKEKYNPQYGAGGAYALIDGLHGNEDWRKGKWQGYQACDFEATIDLGEEKEISTLKACFLQDAGAWIMMPKQLVFEVSRDKHKFLSLEKLQNKVADTDDKVQVQSFVKQIKPYKARYVRIKASNYGALPPWNQGAGNPAFIFVDEIEIQ